MEINKKQLVCWSQKRETNYTYHDDVMGEIKIKITEIIDDKGKQLSVPEVKILKDNYSLPNLVKSVFEKHHKLKINLQNQGGKS